MAHTATVDLDELAALTGACNVAHAPDAKDIAALHAQLASSLYHLSATHPPVVPQDAFAPSNTPTSSSMMMMQHRQAPWTSPVAEAYAHAWPSTPSASTATSASSRGTSFEDNEEEMTLDSPIPTPNGPGPNAFFPHSPLPMRGNTMNHSSGIGGGGGGGRPCTPVLPTTTGSTNLVHPNSASHFQFQYHSGYPTINSTLDIAHDPTTNTFATSDPFYIDLQQRQKTQQQHQRSRTLQAIPLSLQVQGQAAYSVQYTPLLRQNHTQEDTPNPPSSSSSSNPFGLRPRW